MIHLVFRRIVPLKTTFCMSTGICASSFPSLAAAFSVYMLTSGLSHDTIQSGLATQSTAVRKWVNPGRAFRDLRLVSPSRFFVSTNATFSSSEVEQMRISAGNDSLKADFNKIQVIKWRDVLVPYFDIISHSYVFPKCFVPMGLFEVDIGMKRRTRMLSRR